MKVAFFMLSLICALLLSALAFIIATGKVPFRDPEIMKQDRWTPDPRAEQTVQTNVAAIKNLVDSLGFEREKLRKREMALEDRREGEELKIMLGRLEDLKAQIENGLVDLKNEMQTIEASERKNLKSLGDVYSRMDPGNAADILEEMEPRRAAMILHLMNERNAAGILDAMAEKGKDSQAIARDWADIIRKIKTEN